MTFTNEGKCPLAHGYLHATWEQDEHGGAGYIYVLDDGGAAEPARQVEDHDASVVYDLDADGKVIGVEILVGPLPVGGR